MIITWRSFFNGSPNQYITDMLDALDALNPIKDHAPGQLIEAVPYFCGWLEECNKLGLVQAHECTAIMRAYAQTFVGTQVPEITRRDLIKFALSVVMKR